MDKGIQEKFEAIEREIESQKGMLESTTKRYLKTIQELERSKSVVKLLPLDVLELEWQVSEYIPYDVTTHLRFNGGDKEYAVLFDAGFEFPIKPRFNEYTQSFYRDGRLTINDSLNGDIVIEASVGNIDKPPSCKIIETKKRKTVKTFEAICEETGEKI